MSRYAAATATATATALRIGGDALLANPLRTLLATLGVIIGVASFVAVLSLGDGMQAAARAQLEQLTDVQTVTVAARTYRDIDGEHIPVKGYPIFTPADAAQAAAATGATGVSLFEKAGVMVDYPHNGKRRATGVSGVLSRADEFHHMRLTEGRFFTDVEAEHGLAVVILSQKLARELVAGADPRRLINQQVRVNGVAMSVIGVLQAYAGEVGYDAYIPFQTGRKIFPPSDPPRPATMLLRASSVEGVDQLKANAEDWAAQHYARLEKLDIHTQKARVEQAEQGILIFKMFMAALTGISLLVGGIGIMNVLLASVTERTREIGVRKAIGAQRRDVLLQFLTESVAISGAGSAIGVVLGLIAAFGVTAIIRASANAPFFHAGFSWMTILVAVGSALLIGLAFGTYPALRASRMSPIEAIRHE
ncbi:MAG: ABC transporter permease [Gemmatimonadaceae bacterium]|nr:ABC transporter permease [Gemmatimonadaceae bacterium]